MSMFSEEKNFLHRLVVSEQDIPNGNEEPGLSFAVRVLKPQNLEELCDCHPYKDIHYLLPTSNFCKRLFSKAGYLLNNRRKSLNPSNLKAQ